MSRWVIASCVFSSLTVVGIGVIAFLLVQETERCKRRDAEVTAKIESLGRDLRSQLTAPVVSPKELLGGCTANNEVTCTYTNLSPRVVSTCVQGTLVAISAPDQKMQSVPICTGPIQPFSTRGMTAPWGGTAKDICRSVRYGTEFLDWDKCRFTSEPVLPPTAG